MEFIYRIIAETPSWVPLILIYMGLGIALKSGNVSFGDIKFFDILSSKIFSLGTIGIIVGIIAGVIGSIIGVIQIGIFFGWWPETLAKSEIDDVVFMLSNLSRDYSLRVA